MNRSQSPSRSKWRGGEMPGSGEWLEHVSLDLAMQDAPETREAMLRAAQHSEAAGLAVGQLAKRAAALRDALRVAEKERAALTSSIRALEPLFGDSSPIKMICDSLEESNKLAAAESQQVGSLLADALRPFGEDAGAAKREHKALCKSRSTCESWADKVAANERKDVPSGKGDDALVQLMDSRAFYRKALLDYVDTIKRTHRDMKAKVCKQLLEFWITRHSSIRSIEKTMFEVQPYVVAALVHETETAVTARREIEKKESEERRSIEGSDAIPGSVVCHNNFLQGWLLHRSSGKLGTWTRRYFRLQDGVLKSVGEGESISIPLVTARVKPCVGEQDRRRCFSVVGPSDELLLQASSAQEVELWQRAAEAETVRMLHGAASAREGFAGGEQRGGGGAPLALLQQSDPANAVCADCGAPGPDWAAINLGVLVCIACSGVHRSLGVHVSKVRSFRLDSWSDGELAVMKRLGNTRTSRQLLEALPARVERPGPDSAVSVRESFLQAKYVRKEMLPPLPEEEELERDEVLGEEEKSVRREKCLERALLDRVEAGNLPAALHALLRGAAASPRALVLAARAGDLAVAELLLLHGADVKQHVSGTESALHAAAARGDVQMAAALFRRGALPDARDQDGLTPAQLAAQAGNADCVTLLRLASLAAAEKDRGDFSGLLEEFSRNLAEQREHAK